ncbi:glutaminyl-peptide cyclotransferase [Morus notabilis]|uniref:glutaminyl-peptide cyclotransferase n=1 Tax=Morus notabilis TaxID=981085 RepID=UPI000CED72F4|nr:glutaminyl-peptide cyclotransferase [Morus notabilis]
MASSSQSHRKRLNKRSSSNSYSSMASRPTPPNYRKISLTFSVFLIFCVVLTLGISSNMWNKLNSSSVSPTIYSIEVVNEFPHDPQAFTQGLVYAENDTLFESTGLKGRSTVRNVALQNGKVEVIQRMDDSYFGEGLTLIDRRLFQVTWLTKTGFIYDRYNLSKFKKFTHKMKDGWGLATDGKVMFGSDGTSILYKIDPQTLKVTDKQIVKFNGYEVHNLNELEFIKGEVWANVWMTDCIARISHEDGSVLGWILLPTLREGLLRKGYTGIDVLNGIAWDSVKDRIFVTGKLWPTLYEIKLHPVKKKYKPRVIEQLCLRASHDFGRA